jgi:hypothetical protein
MLGSQLRASQGTPAFMPRGLRLEPQQVKPPARRSWQRISSSIRGGSWRSALMMLSRKDLKGMTSYSCQYVAIM